MKNWNTRFIENLHVPFWLIKDSSWAMGFKFVGMTMIIPTLTLAIWIVYKTKMQKMDLLPNIAVLFWISANCIWMVDEFYELSIKTYCYVPFALGIITIVYWFALVLKNKYWVTN